MMNNLTRKTQKILITNCEEEPLVCLHNLLALCASKEAEEFLSPHDPYAVRHMVMKLRDMADELCEIYYYGQ